MTARNPDPILGLIAEYRRHQIAFNAAAENTPERDAAFKALYGVADVIARTVPPTMAGFAASVALFTEMTANDEISDAQAAAWPRTFNLAGSVSEKVRHGDAVLALIAEHKALGDEMETTAGERTDAEAAEHKRQGKRSNEVLEAIWGTAPTTPEGLAASLRYYKELRDGWSLDDDAWLETLASSVADLSTARARDMASMIGDVDDEQFRALDRGIGTLYTLAFSVSQGGDTVALNVFEVGFAMLYLAENLRRDFDKARELVGAAADHARPNLKAERAENERLRDLADVAEMEARVKALRERVGTLS